MLQDHARLFTDTEEPRHSKCCSNLQRMFLTHPCLYGIAFIGIITLDLSELTNDWLLLKDISAVEKGLVYGPVQPVTGFIMLLICAVESLTYTFEILNLVREFSSGDPWMDNDLISAVNIWLADIGMVAVNIVILLCHNEPVSYFQLTKALLVIMSVILRLLVPLLRTYMEKGRPTPKFRKSIYRTISAVGICVMFSGAMTIFIFTHVIAIDEHEFQLRLPHEIWEGDFAFKRYFTDVGIYFKHETVKFETEKDMEQYWIKLVDMQTFYETKNMNVKLIFSEILVGKTMVTQKIIIRSYDRTSIRYTECYKLNKGENADTTYVSADCDTNFITQDENTLQIVFRFVFIHAKLHLILGNVVYNVKYMKNNICYKNLWTNETEIFYEATNDLFGKILYMKQKDVERGHHRLVHVDNSGNKSTASITQTTQHRLSEADEIWRTGMYGCRCSGQHGPEMNASLGLSC